MDPMHRPEPGFYTLMRGNMDYVWAIWQRSHDNSEPDTVVSLHKTRDGALEAKARLAREARVPEEWFTVADWTLGE